MLLHFWFSFESFFFNLALGFDHSRQPLAFLYLFHFMYITLQARAGSCCCIIHTDAVILSNWTHEARVPGDTFASSRRPGLSSNCFHLHWWPLGAISGDSEEIVHHIRGPSRFRVEISAGRMYGYRNGRDRGCRRWLSPGDKKKSFSRIH